MRRHKSTYSSLLRLFLDLPDLTPWERARIQRTLHGERPDAIASLARDMIETLIERGVLRELPPGERGGRRLEDPRNHRVFHISDSRRPLIRRVYPAPAGGPGLIDTASWKEGAPTTLDLSRLLDPRELAGFLERELGQRLGVQRCVFHPVRVPAEWTGILREERPAPILPDIVEEAAHDAGDMLYAPDLTRIPPAEGEERREGSLLVLGVGSREAAWRGALEWHAPDPYAFSPARRTAAADLGRFFQGRLTASFRLQALVFRDVLTGVYNRSYFEDQVEKEIQLARRKGETLGLCIIDIDDFKAFNTRFGYAGGDRVLREVAQRLRASLRASDTLARFGGDEFAALLAPPFAPHEGPLIAARIRDTICGLRFELETLDQALRQTVVGV
ncbi:MAG: diguanylate cyclase, partial [Candidatus Eisenbacteria bacterium]|nr:diguanylate cyclase [Candidatus Eisenbacteria bacterium]